MSRMLLVLPYLSEDMEPLGILYLASAIAEHGHKARLVAPQRAEVARAIQEFAPDVIGYSVITGSQRQYLGLSNWIRHELGYQALAVFGGPHPTFFPEFIEQRGVDAICVGEGEAALVDLLDRIDGGQSYIDTPNWAFRHEGEIVRNPVRSLIAHMDDIPFPDRDLLRGVRGYRLGYIRAFIASRGCPYNCSYCFNHAWHSLYSDRGMRLRSVDNLITEIKEVRSRFGARTVAFYDDIFITKPSWLEEFARRYRAEVGIPFECNLRIEQVSHRTLAALRQAGCAIIATGIESADEAMRTEVLRRRHTNEEVIEACRLIREYGILLKAYNILGLPPGHIEDDLATAALNVTCKVDIPTASIFQPYPNTDLGERARREGYWDGDVDQMQLGFYRTSPLRLRDREQIELLQRLFELAVKCPWTLPGIKWALPLARYRPFLRTVDAAHSCVHKLARLWGRYVPVAESIRRRLYRNVGRLDAPVPSAEPIDASAPLMHSEVQLIQVTRKGGPR